MPTHGRSLSSGSIDELTLKDDSACLALRREEEDGMRSVYVWFLNIQESAGKCCPLNVCICLYGSTAVKLDGKERSLKDTGVCVNVGIAALL